MYLRSDGLFVSARELIHIAIEHNVTMAQPPNASFGSSANLE